MNDQEYSFAVGQVYLDKRDGRQIRINEIKEGGSVLRLQWSDLKPGDLCPYVALDRFIEIADITSPVKASAVLFQDDELGALRTAFNLMGIDPIKVAEFVRDPSNSPHHAILLSCVSLDERKLKARGVSNVLSWVRDWQMLQPTYQMACADLKERQSFFAGLLNSFRSRRFPQRRKMTNPNLCEKCIGSDRPESGFDLADTGRCGACGEINEVWDLPHLAALKAGGKPVYAADGYTTLNDRIRDSHMR